MNHNDKEFFGHAITECLKKKIKIVFEHKSFVWADGIKCSGYFDEDDKELWVATRKPQRDFFPVFVHEFSHFQQWLQSDPVYMKISSARDIDNDMWEWINGKDIPEDRVNKSIQAYQEMELGCEKRVVEHIEKSGLSIEKNNYIKMANIYVLFYSLVRETRKWYKTPPYTIKGVLDCIPSTFIESFDISDDYRRIILKRCF